MEHLAAYANVVVPCTTDGKVMAFGVLEQTNTLVLHNDSEIAGALGKVVTTKSWEGWKANRVNVWNKIEIRG